MREIGFFSDLPYGEPTEMRVGDVVGLLSERLVHKTADYLRSGGVVAAAAGKSYDAVDTQAPEIGPMEILTDGDWTWPSDLAYYVEKYRVGLPEEFIRHAEGLNWRPPQLTDQELEELAEVM